MLNFICVKYINYKFICIMGVRICSIVYIELNRLSLFYSYTVQPANNAHPRDSTKMTPMYRPGGSGRAGRARARPKVQPGRKRSGRLSTSPTKNSGPTGSGGPRPYQKLAQALPKIQSRRKQSGRLGSARPKIQARPKFRPGPDQMKSASAGPDV